jgi:geranylgeranyl pyrophosphate synthase
MLQVKERADLIVPIADSLLGVVQQSMLELVVGLSIKSEVMRAPAAKAAAHHLASGGSHVRARIALSAGLALDLPPNVLVSLAAAAELLHNASLIHDDLQDRDQIRRGVPTVWAKFGDRVGLCVGDLFLSAAFAAVAQAGEGAPIAALVGLVHATTSAAIRGQCDGFDMAASASEDLGRYEAMAVAKSGSLLSLPLELVLTAANLLESLPLARQAAGEFAIGYQIADDLCDYQTDLGNGQQPASANIVRILESAGNEESTFSHASRLGWRHLCMANDLAMRLPIHSGDLLAKLSTDLASQFEIGL